MIRQPQNFKVFESDKEINFGIEVSIQVPVPQQQVKGQKAPPKQEFVTKIDPVNQAKLFTLQLKKVL